MAARWEGEIRAGIVAMQASGDVGAGVDAGRTAAAILVGIQGGVVLQMSTGSVADLEAALDTAIAALRATAP
ncbi:hypothetical protein [Pseudonocardia sp. N23]|uniref:hypothetical protein n=1 Tax=Pseudonocardia sp. N23 TaxID=1987376 RepID=UPI000BFD43ED|nr:hypothetical protein [Pseudonocardia sp. N23]GAY07454.1 hypothetical protein TOK_3474 [Pseudonocardia sp. N23]